MNKKDIENTISKAEFISNDKYHELTCIGCIYLAGAAIANVNGEVTGYINICTKAGNFIREMKRTEVCIKHKLFEEGVIVE